MNKNRLKYKTGFSLIEVILSMTLIAIIIPTVGGILMSVMRQQLVLNQLSLLKREGDSIAAIIKKEIEQEPVQIYISNSMVSANLRCHPSRAGLVPFPEFVTGSQLFLKRRNNTYVTFRVNNTNNMHILQRTTNNGGLVTDNVHSQLTRIVSFRMECLMQSQYGAPLINIVFTLAPRLQTEDITLQKQLYYQIRVKASTF